jgi:hypothetical protein
MKHLKLFESGSFDIGRFTITMKRAIAALESKDISTFISLYNGTIKDMLNTSEARERVDLIKALGEGLDAAQATLTPEERRQIMDACHSGLTAQIDQNPELKAKYGI